MQKAIKIVAGFISGLILLVLAAIVALVVFVNPNDYKPQITQKVYQYTGRQLTLQGDISWTFFPRLGLQINQAQLSNPPGFNDQPFVKVKEVDVGVALLPLLSGRVDFGKITLNGIELNLIKNKNGVTNWQDLAARFGQQKVPANNTTPAAPGTKNYFAAFALADININDGHIRWRDWQAKKSYETAVSLKGNVTVDKQQETLNINRLKLVVDESTLIGTIVVKNFTKPTLIFGLNLDHINLNRYSPAKSSTVRVPKPQPKSAAASAGLLPVALLRNVNVEGRLQIGSLQLGKLNPTDIILQLKATNGLWKLNSITARIYQGTYSGNLNLDVRGVLPRVASNIQLKNIQAEPLFRDMSNVTRLQLSGVGDFNAQLTTQGNSSDALISHLSGQGKLFFAKGVLKGVNISYWIETARALIRRQLPPAQQGPNQTDFGNLTATFIITNGMVKNNDLLLRAANLEAKGEGAADLVNQRLDYRLNARLLRANGQPESAAIPLRISGPFSDIKIGPAVENLLRGQLKEKITDEINRRLDNDVGNKLKNTLGSLFN